MLNVHELCATAGLHSTVHAASIAQLQQCIARTSLALKVHHSPLARKLCTMCALERVAQ
jgi:hypothetical protein